MLSFPLRESVLSYLPPKLQEEIWKINQSPSTTKGISTLFNKDIIKELANYIDEFGRIILGKYQKIITFIIKTKTQPTIALKTLNVFIGSFTWPYTAMKNICVRCIQKGKTQTHILKGKSGRFLRREEKFFRAHLRPIGLIEKKQTLGRV